MMLKLSDALNICLIQIHTLVDNITKRNFPQSSREISEVITVICETTAVSRWRNVSRSLSLSPRLRPCFVVKSVLINPVLGLFSFVNSLDWKQKGNFCAVYFHQSTSETLTQRRPRCSRNYCQASYLRFSTSHRSSRACVSPSRTFFPSKR